MSSTTHHHQGAFSRLTMNRMGLWLFFVSEAFMFTGILAARFVLLPGTRPHLNQTLGLITTSVLLLSSYFMYRAETAIGQGRHKDFVWSTFLTMLLGIAFLVGVVGLEWGEAPFGPADGAEGAVFYFMTGMHAFHVLTGVIFLFVVWNNGRRGKYAQDDHWGVEACALYWHFVDVVWVFFYPALYLIGTVH